MASIWDPPNSTTQMDSDVAKVTVGNAPMVDPRPRQYGADAGTLWTAQGRGVVNGAPYGLNLQAEVAEHNRTWLFSPGFAASSRAATRAALGR